MSLKKQILFGAAFATVFTACTETEVPSDPSVPAQTVSSRVSLNVYSFGDTSRVEDLAANYTTLNGYFFSDGKLDTLYTGLTAEDNSYTLELPAMEGTLYFVANPSADFTGKVTAQLAQDAFLQLTSGRDGIDSAAPMTTAIQVGSHSDYDHLSATLSRAVARVDVQPLSADVTITGITLSGVAQNGYYFAQPSVQTAAGGIIALSRSFDSPLAALQTGVFHLYEQSGNIPVEVQARVNGLPRTFSAALPATIERNHIYTVKVTATGVRVAVSVGIGEWEQGEDTVIDTGN